MAQHDDVEAIASTGDGAANGVSTVLLDVVTYGDLPNRSSRPREDLLCQFPLAQEAPRCRPGV